MLQRILLSELFLEIRLTGKKHIVVEGFSDARFIRSWLYEVEGGADVAVTAVGELMVPSDDVAAVGLTVNNRGRVVLVALRASVGGVDIRAVADRDCGHDVADHQYETLCWTDFPALESYALDEEVLNRANLLSFGELLPPGAELLDQLAFALRELFAVRRMHPNLAAPKLSAAMGEGAPLKGFDVARAVPAPIRPYVAGYERSKSSDPREFAYGHDVAALLLAAFGNVIKNKLGIHKQAAVEAALLSAVQAVGSFADEALFVALGNWVQTAASE